MSYEDGGMPAGGNSRFRGYPARMSERQQLALILQMTSQEMTPGSSNRSENIPLSNSRSSPLQHQKSSKSRWSNKSADLDGNSSFNRQDDRFRLANGCESKDCSEFAGSNSPDEVRTATGAESPVAAGSPAESAATVIPTDKLGASAPPPASEEAVDNKGPSGTTSSSTSSSQQHQNQEDAAGAPYEMRRTPPQNKADRQTTASSGGGGSNNCTAGSGGGGGSSATSSSSSQQQQQQQSGIGGGSRVTLRLNQVRSARDEKKVTASGAAAAPGTTSVGCTSTANTATRQTGAASSGSSSTAAALSASQMESSSTKSSGSGGSSSTITGTSSSSSGGISGGGGQGSGGNNSNNGSSSSSADGGDVYEFKSSKEATPVRGSSTSPNPNPEKEGKDAGSSVLSSPTGSGQGQGNSSAGGNPGVTGSTGGVSSNLNSNTSSSSNSGIGSSSACSTSTSADALSTSISAAMPDEPMITTPSPQSCSPSNKRSYENDGQDDQDEEGRKRKKKENESNKDGGTKGSIGNRQTTARSNSNTSEKQCAKSGKQPSPSSSFNANSPKPSSSNNPKGSTPSIESDGEDDRSKNSDCNLAPKVPPLKLVVQNSNSEPEQGNRNGKNTSNRGHQLHYVVASSNSNDSMDKDQIMSGATSGTTSPLDGSGIASKSEDKKDFTGALDGDSRSTHHQRVLRSSHRSGNGGNGGKETAGGLSGNGNYSNSSPLSVNAADISNHSSPQQRYNSPTPESGRPSESGKPISSDGSNQNNPAVKSGNTSDKCEKNIEIKKEAVDPSEINIKKENTSEMPSTSSQAPVEFHPRKRKIKTNKEAQQAAAAATAAVNETIETTNTGPEVHPHDQPITNCIQLFMNIRKQIQQRRKGLFPVKPKPPQGFKNYLLNRCTYMLAGNASDEPNVNPPGNLTGPMKDLFINQEKERYNLRMQHVVEKEKLVLAKEQEIIRVHGRAARALANQELPFSVCTFLKDEEVYNLITPEQEEKDRNARSRYTGRMFISWLQDVDDKWEKIKEGMILRHHNEAESLHAVQRMDWEWKLKEVGLCEFKVTPKIDKLHVPIVHVSDDFDLLPA